MNLCAGSYLTREDFALPAKSAFSPKFCENCHKSSAKRKTHHFSTLTQFFIKNYVIFGVFLNSQKMPKLCENTKNCHLSQSGSNPGLTIW
jgi:hypothetical protein